VSKSGVIGRPRGRPFAKGQSGNPGGRAIKPKTIELRKLEHDVRMFARDRGAEAIDTLVALMRGVVTVEIDKKPVQMLVTPMTQLAAANAVLDCGNGRPHQSVEMTGKDSGPIQTEEISAYEIIVGRLETSLSDSERTGTLKKLLSSSTENLCARVKEGHLSFSVAYDAPPRVVFVDLVHHDASIDVMPFAANALPRSVR
jgi:hypothetical protein